MVNHGECEQKLRKTRLTSAFDLHESFVCAGGELTKDTCKGDGGGPLICPAQGTVRSNNLNSEKFIQVLGFEIFFQQHIK